MVGNMQKKKNTKKGWRLWESNPRLFAGTAMQSERSTPELNPH
jgi:hypothetical protein